MKAELLKRLFKAIFAEDIISLKKIALAIISDERKLGHTVLANSLEQISITEKPRFSSTNDKNYSNGSSSLSSLPTSKRDNSQLMLEMVLGLLLLLQRLHI